jgi:sortase (surface protein transpeptidase)
VSGRNVNQPASVGAPTAIDIPSIGVRSPLLRLGVAADGTAQVPSDPQRAGWFTGGPRPGEEGPAVILGHIDSRTSPAVFYRLHELRPGANVIVHADSGASVRFTVDRLEQVAKDAFPTAEVYGPAFGAQLRLITCGGSFDRSKGHYTDNVIVFLTADRSAGRP